MSPSERSPSDTEATVIRPTPGKRSGREPLRERERERERVRERERDDDDEAPPKLVSGAQPLPDTGLNPLVTAAAPLLALASRLRQSVSPPNIDSLHARLLQELGNFERRAGDEGVTPKVIAEARYALSAMVDDVVQNTPWGMDSHWAKRSMVHTFHREAVSGERFFDVLEARQKDPSNHLDLLELMYLCMAMGFEGQYRVLPRGASEFARLRDDLYQVIRNLRGEFERELSPHWKGVDASQRPLSSLIPVWVIAAGTAAALVAMFFAYYFFLGNATSALMARLRDLPPGINVALAGQPEVPVPIPTLPRAPDDPLAKVTGFLQPEIDAHMVEVFANGSSLTVRLVGVMFNPAKDTIVPERVAVLRRIGEALNDQAGQVKIVGHTDSDAIHTVRFPSNYELSLARAVAVQGVIGETLADDSRMASEGHGDADPIASNDTADGKGKNRRVEVILIRPTA